MKRKEIVRQLVEPPNNNPFEVAVKTRNEIFKVWPVPYWHDKQDLSGLKSLVEYKSGRRVCGTNRT